MMNKFKKYCPNVWVAECEEEYEKGDVIQLETKYGKEVDCTVYNHLFSRNDFHYYSIVRNEEKSYAQRKAEKYNNASSNYENKSNERWEASHEGKEFLSLGEPIKVGHHSEGRHRALIERNFKRMEKAMEYQESAEASKRRAEYWESKANEINLSMPESIEFYEYKLDLAKKTQAGLKDGSIEREHSYSLTYATKEVKDLTEKLKIANELWG